MTESGSITEPAGTPAVTARVPADLQGVRLDQAAAQLFPDYSRARLQAWIAAGRLLLNGTVPARPRDKVAAGDELLLQPQLEPDGNVPAQDLPFAVVYADAALAVVDKPAGLTVHPGAGAPSGTLQNALLHRFPQTAGLPRAGLVHRLDKGTSGLLVVALTLPAHTSLVRMMQAREITREYAALVSGRVTAGGSVDAPVGRDPRQRTRMAVVAGGRRAVTHYRVAERFAAHTLLNVRLETGRTHQIRVHMRHIGHPLVGDAAYGGGGARGRGLPAEVRSTLTAFPRQALHARRLAFAHPVDASPSAFEAALPADLQVLLSLLRRCTPDHGD